jgi:hypothetical protein
LCTFPFLADETLGSMIAKGLFYGISKSRGSWVLFCRRKAVTYLSFRITWQSRAKTSFLVNSLLLILHHSCHIIPHLQLHPSLFFRTKSSYIKLTSWAHTTLSLKGIIKNVRLKMTEDILRNKVIDSRRDFSPSL